MGRLTQALIWLRNLVLAFLAQQLPRPRCPCPLTSAHSCPKDRLFLPDPTLGSHCFCSTLAAHVGIQRAFVHLTAGGHFECPGYDPRTGLAHTRPSPGSLRQKEKSGLWSLPLFEILIFYSLRIFFQRGKGREKGVGKRRCERSIDQLPLTHQGLNLQPRHVP